MKRRKPDLLFVLVLIVGLGVLVTGWAQGLLGDAEARPAGFSGQTAWTQGQQ